MRADQNRYVGVHLMGLGTMVRNSQIVDTGGSTAPGFAPDGEAIGIWLDGAGSRALNNDVAGTVSTGNANATSIFMNQASGSVAENTVTRLWEQARLVRPVPMRAAEAGAGVACLLDRRRVGDGRPRSDRFGRVGNDVGDGEGRHPRRKGGGAEPPALDPRKMAADEVQFLDRRPGAPEVPGHDLAVVAGVVREQDPQPAEEALAARGDADARGAFATAELAGDLGDGP